MPDLYHRWNCADHADQTRDFNELSGSGGETAYQYHTEPERSDHSPDFQDRLPER